MQLLASVEHLILLILIFALSYLVWLRYQDEQKQPKKKDKKKDKKKKAKKKMNKTNRGHTSTYRVLEKARKKSAKAA